MNTLRTFILLAALTAFFLVIGYLVGGTGGVIIAFLIALAMNAFSYWNADKIVLRMHHATEVDKQAAPGFYGIVEQLAANAELPMPRVFILEEKQPNAFATGRGPNSAAVAATRGLIERLSERELAGVMAHELAHVKNRDTLLMTITATIAGAISMIANFAMFAPFFGGGGDDEEGGNPLGMVGMLVIAFLAPMAAGLVQMAISRTREYKADRDGAAICGHPEWLADALARIDAYAKGTPNQTAERNPASAHLFIINPLSGKSMDNLFSTHPSLDERITLLREMGGGERAGAARGPWAS